MLESRWFHRALALQTALCGSQTCLKIQTAGGWGCPSPLELNSTGQGQEHRICNQVILILWQLTEAPGPLGSGSRGLGQTGVRLPLSRPCSAVSGSLRVCCDPLATAQARRPWGPWERGGGRGEESGGVGLGEVLCVEHLSWWDCNVITPMAYATQYLPGLQWGEEEFGGTALRQSVGSAHILSSTPGSHRQGSRGEPAPMGVYSVPGFPLVLCLYDTSKPRSHPTIVDPTLQRNVRLTKVFIFIGPVHN